MVIYGVAILSGCMFAGLFLGNLLGKVLGVNSDVGGVGIAMLILVILVDYLIKKGKLSKKSQEGLSFWSSMYIPIVVAMTANQNVVAAVKGGPVAILAGVIAVVVAFVFIPVISKLGGDSKIGQSNSKDVKGAR